MPQTIYGFVSQTRLDQIRTLRDQFEQISGYAFEIPEWMISNIAGDAKAIGTLYDFGQYIAGQVSAGVLTSQQAYGGLQPWIWYGMTPAEYHSKLEAFDSTFRTLTGQSAPSNLVDAALHQHQGSMTGAQFNTWLLAQDSIKQQYGWLKYGLDFNQFQTQKLQMRTSFGRDLTDAEAVTQLQYLHTSGGANVGVSAQPTLGQVEKKQAQTGVSGSVVR